MALDAFVGRLADERATAPAREPHRRGRFLPVAFAALSAARETLGATCPEWFRFFLGRLDNSFGLLPAVAASCRWPSTPCRQRSQRALLYGRLAVELFFLPRPAVFPPSRWPSACRSFAAFSSSGRFLPVALAAAILAAWLSLATRSVVEDAEGFPSVLRDFPHL